MPSIDPELRIAWAGTALYTAPEYFLGKSGTPCPGMQAVAGADAGDFTMPIPAILFMKCLRPIIV